MNSPEQSPTAPPTPQRWDYSDPNFIRVYPDAAFPNRVVGDPMRNTWPYLRRAIPHTWYVDRRNPMVGFLNRDESQLIYNIALPFRGQTGLEIGCWMGWSACHIALAGVVLDVVDPLFNDPVLLQSVRDSLASAGVLHTTNLVVGASPEAVTQLAKAHNKRWPFIFIDGDHEGHAPLQDAQVCEKLAADDAVILFHDLAAPAVAEGLAFLRHSGWQTLIYQTAQIMGIAWRGCMTPINHRPDPRINWPLPDFLRTFPCAGTPQAQQLLDNLAPFYQCLPQIRPYTMLSQARLFNLFQQAKQICDADLPGDFVECGSWRGGAAALLAWVVRRYSRRPRSVYAFDTFAGMPQATARDKSAQGTHADKTPFGTGTLSAPLEQYLLKIAQQLQLLDVIKPIQGLFQDTFPTIAPQIPTIALLHADADWYESTQLIFATFYDKVIPGGTVQIDDYGAWQGCKEAVDEFFAQRNINLALHPLDFTGVYFIKP
ncbi:macrocin-O-methyltransferase domain protein [Magnetococcus marinus MC-1]|uniref:Macrocin-O-methyltransferase domain protein n=1 Tax=Magnetococcus marinus (strain ATCC BAA-1437 / JCM 17883 / MC-1) TaxID=156889 RepID=A0LD95_MAGMM|nr:TylF/MycF/NovP-related O-methyltransferase [Magnetococcus marinus]ABK45938.1 macrocin-O-methyltransferase domain protein [Magnetococcus marinus MC-1]